MAYKIKFTTASHKLILLVGTGALIPQVFQLDRVEKDTASAIAIHDEIRLRTSGKAGIGR